MRSVRVLARVARFAVGHPFARRERRPARARELFEDLGGLYLKLGQLLSLQPDVLAPSTTEALYDLLDRVPPMPWEKAAEVFREELGRDPDEVFDRIEHEPMASASIAQVHGADLDGERVVVKVQRPEARERFEADLVLLARVRAAIRRGPFASLRWLADAISELELWTREELDFRREAHYQRIVGRVCADSPTERVPEVVDRLSSRRILVSERLEGPTVLDLLRAGEEAEGEGRAAPPSFDRELFAERLVRNFVGGAFERGVFHADLHPANLIVLEDNVVGYVDFGITSSLSRHTRRRIVALVLALLDRDGEAMAEHLCAIASHPENVDEADLRGAIEGSFERWYGRGNSSDAPRLRRRFTTILSDILRITRRFGAVSTPDTARYLRSVISTEGLISRFAPGFDIEACLGRVCREQLEGEALRSWFHVERLSDWIAESARSIADGRDRVRSRAPAVDAAAEGERAPTPVRAAALALAALALSLVVLTTETPAWGWNVFSLASAALLGVAVAAFGVLSRGRG